jgi:hypothetical protein
MSGPPDTDRRVLPRKGHCSDLVEPYWQGHAKCQWRDDNDRRKLDDEGCDLSNQRVPIRRYQNQ